MRTEYKVVPAPERATKKRGLKGAALFAHSVEALMNELAADGWTYVRADTLPQEERSGLTNKVTTYRNLLVFQRVAKDAQDASEPAPKAETPPAMPAPDSPPTATDAMGDEEEVINLWQPTDDAAEPSADTLVADRKR